MGQREVLSLNVSMKGKATSVCPLDSVLKKEVQPGQGDALYSARYGLGRGVKRKLSECEEPSPDLPYPQQRQLVLDLCLDKLQSCQRHADPCLHRSVLLTNTLRQIQQEIKLEGGDAPPPPWASQLPPPTPRHVPELPLVSPSSPLPLPSEPVSTSPPTLAAEAYTKTPDSLFGTFEITNSTSYLRDLALDDIFEDIDTSMYDVSEIPAFNAPKDDGAKNLSNLQLCLADLSDLDHIMDILVRP